VTKVDVDRAQLAVVRAEQMEREARLGQERTYRALGTLMQEPRPFKVQLGPVAAHVPDQNALDLALKLRPEFRALQASVDSANSEARADAWRWAPTLSAFGNVRRFNYDNFALDRHSWAVGGQLDWVLFDGGVRDAARHLARARAAETAARVDVLRDSIRDDLADGRSELDTKQRGLEAAERSVALAKETLELVRVQYEAGSVTQVDLLQAQDALVAAQEALAQAHYDVANADLFLRRAAGTFPGS
jgi:outer membrane protein